MKRYLIENCGANPEMVEDGLTWLREKGGGDVVACTKSVYRNTFDIRTDGENKRIERLLRQDDIRLLTSRGGFVSRETVFALYPDKRILNEIEESSKIKEVLVLGWNEYDYKEWAELYTPELLPGGNPTPKEIKNRT